MKLIIIRHGDPDYEIDSLTEKGKIEAELLSNRLIKIDIDDIYCSPLGRAKRTAKPYIEKVGKDLKIAPWLEEFNYATIDDPENSGNRKQIWDFSQEFYAKNTMLHKNDEWYKTDFIRNSDVKKAYDAVCNGLDEMLASHGYVRKEGYYSAERANHDTVVLFCHLGVEAVLLSHLLFTSPLIFSQGCCPLPTSVTTLVTEERKKGIALFRCTSLGDLSHLYAANEAPAFAARFCECYEDDTRH